MQPIKNKIVSRIYGNGRGWVFTPKDFADLGSRRNVDVVLHRSVMAGIITRAARGIYYYPRKSEKFGDLPPAIDLVADAIARRDNAKIQVSGAHAANMLGMSDQVPMKPVYQTTGRTRRIKVGGREILLVQRSNRSMGSADKTFGQLIAALRWLGRKNMNKGIIQTLHRRLKDSDKSQVRRNLRYAPAWIADMMRQYVDEEG